MPQKTQVKLAETKQRFIFLLTERSLTIRSSRLACSKFLGYKDPRLHSPDHLIFAKRPPQLQLQCNIHSPESKKESATKTRVCFLAGSTASEAFSQRLHSVTHASSVAERMLNKFFQPGTLSCQLRLRVYYQWKGAKCALYEHLETSATPSYLTHFIFKLYHLFPSEP